MARLSVALLSLVFGLASAAPQSANSTSLPVVDLKHQRHRAALLDDFGFYNFSNIRFAQPPVGELRFQAPRAPEGRNGTIDDGSVGRMCPQTLPLWLEVAYAATNAVLANETFDTDAALKQAASIPLVHDPRETEDCLFLDVVTPKKAFDKGPVTPSSDEGLPVLVWLYPGGYLVGDKSSVDFSQNTLANTSYGIDPDGVIIVSPNYRLGAFGWLAGPAVQSQTTAQPALYDQRLALEWVQDNIHLFGGNKNRVTVQGLSAGAGSIIHQITAYGGQGGPVPFQQAFVQSGAFLLNPSHIDQENTFNELLKTLGVNTLSEARALPSETLISANDKQSLNLPYGVFNYGPVVDGAFTPDLPGKLLRSGNFHKDIKVMVSRAANEGVLFSDPRLNTSAAYREHLKYVVRGISDPALDYMENTLYPPVFDGSTGYRSEFERYVLTVGDALACNSVYLDHAFGNQTYAYEFGVAPGYHSADLGYQFADLRNRSGVAFPETARAIQEFIMSFVIKGKPEARGFPEFGVYGREQQMMTLNGTGQGMIRDPASNKRCMWWQETLFF